MDNQPLGRRDVLTLAGLASFATVHWPSTAEGAVDRRGSAGRPPAASSTRCSATFPIAPRRQRQEAQRGRARRLHPRNLGARSQRHRDRARLSSRGRAALTGRAPAVVFNHSHGGGYTIGKKEFLEGRTYLQPAPYAKALTDLGYVALCIDHWVFGERSHTTELDMFKAMLWQGQVLWGMMVYDSLQGARLAGRARRRRSARIATLGMSMGSTMAWWLAALDERVKVTVDICCLTDFHTLLAKKGLGGHGVYYYVPGLLKHFTTSQINALIAPRAHLGLAGLQDKLTPVEGLDIIDRELTQVYADAGTSGALEAAALRRRASGNAGGTAGERSRS